MNSGELPRVLPFLVLALAGCATPAVADTNAPPPPTPVHVDTAVAARRDVPSFLPLTGQIKSARETDLAANVAGRVVGTRMERGTAVKAGDVLAAIDVRAATLGAEEARANAATASSQADAANTECARGRALGATGAISPAEVDRLEAQCRTTQLEVTAARARSTLAVQNVGDGSVRAPFDGFVTDRYVDVGEYVRPDTRVATLVDLSSLRLELPVPETSIAVAKAGGSLSFRVPGYPGRDFHGRVRFVSAAVRRETRDVMVEATLDDGADLLPGMFAEVRLQTGTTSLPAIPARALTTRGGLPTVFALVEDHVEERLVQTAGDAGDPVAIARGVQTGERVVLDPAPDLKNGAPVR
jgi:membrane fusion protein (multidrug efflux system)